MSFREKSVWISFLIMLTLSGVWAWNFGRGLTGQAARSDVVRLSITLLIFTMVLEVLLHIILTVWSPKEAPNAARRTRETYRVVCNAYRFSGLGWGSTPHCRVCSPRRQNRRPDGSNDVVRDPRSACEVR